MTFPLLIPAEAAADRLGVGTGRFMAWLARGLIPVAAVDEAGNALIREHYLVGGIAERLARGEVPDEKRDPRPRPALWGRNEPPRALACGCALAHRPDDPPHFLCRDARSLKAAARLAAMFTPAAGDDPFFARLRDVTAAALARHLAWRAVRRSCGGGGVMAASRGSKVRRSRNGGGIRRDGNGAISRRPARRGRPRAMARPAAVAGNAIGAA